MTVLVIAGLVALGAIASGVLLCWLFARLVALEVMRGLHW
jgi:hypothetical protein